MEGEKEMVAEQFTLIESELFSRIQRTYVSRGLLPVFVVLNGFRELTNGKWSKEKLAVLSRNVIRLITRVNEVSYFVATCILLQKVKDFL